MDNSKKTDKELVIRLTDDDETAFTELYIRYKNKMYAFCFTFLKSADETEDLVQELFTNIWESHRFINPDLSFSSYLYTIAHNRMVNYFRNVNIENKVKSILSEIIPQTEETIESEMIYEDYQTILKQAILQLPPQRQRIFNLSREENLSHREIAQQLGISVYTVQEHISESLRFIKSYFSKRTDIKLGVLFILLSAGI